MCCTILFLVVINVALLRNVSALLQDEVTMAAEYYAYKDVKLACYLSCEGQFYNKLVVDKFMEQDVRVSVKRIGRDVGDLERFLHQRIAPIGVLLDGACSNSPLVLETASQAKLLDASRAWFVVNLGTSGNDSAEYIDDKFQHLNLSADADVVVAAYQDHGGYSEYKLTDVFNFGKIQGNHLERNDLATWRRGPGLSVSLKEFKYYNRWDFHNLTLRAVSVILERPQVFRPELLRDVRYTAGISAMTKIAAQLLELLRHQHNFRFNYTIAGRWIGSPLRNSTLAVSNSLFWREQDISCTCARIFPKWLEWVDPFFPPATALETKFYYLIPDKGVGNYENRFLTPMSSSVWCVVGAAGAACALVLCAGAARERRPQPALYAVCSVLAACCQQAYEDGVQMLEDTLSSQSRRLTLLVLGLTGMLMYNYYTSSVVSWLLNAAPPSIASLDALVNSDLELIFEDIGYTRGWVDNPGFYYYSGFKNEKEDILREKKVTHARRTVALLQPAADGIELMRTGEYAYHTEPYTAGQVISRRLDERELCELGALQMMPPAHVYIMGQKRSPYKQFFDWSLMRLLERGHVRAVRARVVGRVPACSGRAPRALALGQAAPAFALLAQGAALATLVLLLEVLCHRIKNKHR